MSEYLRSLSESWTVCNAYYNNKELRHFIHQVRDSEYSTYDGSLRKSESNYFDPRLGDIFGRWQEESRWELFGRICFVAAFILSSSYRQKFQFAVSSIAFSSIIQTQAIERDIRSAIDQTKARRALQAYDSTKLQWGPKFDAATRELIALNPGQSFEDFKNEAYRIATLSVGGLTHNDPALVKRMREGLRISYHPRLSIENIEKFAKMIRGFPLLTERSDALDQAIAKVKVAKIDFITLKNPAAPSAAAAAAI